MDYRTRLGEIASLLVEDRLVTELDWRPAQSYSIERDGSGQGAGPRQIWHAGHVNAILSDGTCVIAGTETGGVWLLNPSVQPSYRDGHRAVPLSNDWSTPDISSLAWGPDRATQVFVGCTDGYGVLLVQLQPLTGEMALKKTTLIPGPFGGPVYAMATLTDSPTITSNSRLVVATQTGVWWSHVPKTIIDADAYVWHAAEGLPDCPYSGLAAAGWSGNSPLETARQNIAVSAYGADPGGNPLLRPLHPQEYGIFLGVWEGEALVFSRAEIDGIELTDMRRTSLASCDNDPSRLYAVAAASDQSISALLGSSDGGAHWHLLKSQLSAALTGYNGDYNQAIAVSPYRPNVVAVGWRAGGPFYSRDGGNSWQHPTSDAKKDTARQDDNLHGDLHALHFARNPLEQDILYIGSDGGIAFSADLGQTNNSQFNRPLNNLQIYGAQRGPQSGAMTASSRFPGLLAIGTQDNGNLFRAPKQEAGQAWQTLDDDDGGLCRFIDPVAALLRIENVQPTVRLAYWDDAKQEFGPYSVVPADGDATGITPTSMEVVREPSWTTGRPLGGGRVRIGLMYACAAVGGGGDLYGFFAAPDGSDAQFLKIGSFGTTVFSLASFDGTVIFAGTGDGRILSITSATGVVAEEVLPASLKDKNASVARLDCLQVQSARLTSLLARQIYALYGGIILQFDGGQWRDFPRSDWGTFAVDEDSGRVFAADDNGVFLFSETDKVWKGVSNGLPSVCHCTDLRIADGVGGGRELYLATYGRSVWQAAITLDPAKTGVQELPPRAARILFRLIEDGGGVARVGEQLIGIPSGPLAQDVLVALAMEHLASSMTSSGSRAMRRAILNNIVTVAQRELDQIR